MKEVILHIDDAHHPIDVHCDADTRPCSAFLLLANIPANPPGCLLLSYGNSDNVGNLLMTLWQRCVHEDPKMAWTLEQVSRGIIEMADAERGKWPGDERAGRA